MNKALHTLVGHIKQTNININFTIIEVGALQIQTKKEPFYELLDYFPSSKIIGFEIEKEVCEKMNSESRKEIKYYAHALGKANERRKLTSKCSCTHPCHLSDSMAYDSKFLKEYFSSDKQND